VPPPSATIGTSIDAVIPSKIMSERLIDQTGAATSLAAYRGKVLIISDMMTLCQETCPIDTATLVQTARAVATAGLASRVEFLSITVDPQRDTPARLAAYRTLFDPAPVDWRLLTGTPSDVSALWGDLGVYYQRVPEDRPPATDWLTGKPLTYDIDHADLVFFIDAAGHERFAIDGAGHAEPGTVLAPRLAQFLNDTGRNNLDHPGADTWTASQALQVIGWLAHRRIPG
jgi:protein SCO1/2